jgi:hypothetical protein
MCGKQTLPKVAGFIAHELHFWVEQQPAFVAVLETLCFFALSLGVLLPILPGQRVGKR